MTTCTPAQLLDHADAVEHTAAVGGYVGPSGQRRHLSDAERRQWAASAAVLREHALAQAGGETAVAAATEAAVSITEDTP